MFSLRAIPLDEFGRVCATAFAGFSPWWIARGGNCPTREMLPGCGVIVDCEDGPVAVAFMYLDATGSGVAWLAWLASNPAVPAVRAGLALDLARLHLEAHAKALNYWLVAAAYHHPSLVALFRSAGYATGDTGMIQLFKPI
jgi:hypothetical protein